MLGGTLALAAGGPDAVRVEALAAGLGVSKGGFYWHFADRQALLGEMLDSWERAGTEDVIARVDGEPGDPRAKLRQLFRAAGPRDRSTARRIVGLSRRERPVLVYDGDCAFCTSCARLLEGIGPEAEIVA